MARPAIQVRVSNPSAEWCWVLQIDLTPSNYPVLIQKACGRRFWVGILEISAGKAGGQQIGTRALWDLLKLPEPTIGHHFFY